MRQLIAGVMQPLPSGIELELSHELPRSMANQAKIEEQSISMSGVIDPSVQVV